MRINLSKRSKAEGASKGEAQFESSSELKEDQTMELTLLAEVAWDDWCKEILPQKLNASLLLYCEILNTTK